MSQVRPWALSLLCLTLAACQQSVMVRPASDGHTPASRPTRVSNSSVPTHTVATGDTLYKISVQYGLDYRDIAAWNEITAPYTIYPKQVLKLGPAGGTPVAPSSAGTSSLAAVPDTPVGRPQPVAPQSAPAPATAATSGTAAAPGYDANLGVTLPEGARPLSGSTAPAAAAAPAFEPAEAEGPVAATPPRTSDAVGSGAAPRGNLPDIHALETAPPPSPATTAALSESGVAGPARATPATSASATAPAAAGAADVVSDKPSAAGWIWPTTGKVVATYAGGDPTRQGVDVAGTAGQPVRAARDGEVVYSGAGLIGYGELIIIKHSPELLSAYGHNRVRLVKEGQKVKAGQKIAEMGRSPANRDLLHFEIRRNGKPVDPLPLLPAR